MAIQTALWKVGRRPERLNESSLATEKLLETMIVSNAELVSEDWLLVGQQVNTGTNGIIDLLAIEPDGTLILIELKRSRASRDAVTQALDYAVWIESVDSTKIDEIYAKFKPQANFAGDFRAKFGGEFDEDMIDPQKHKMVIVASSLDSGSEAIVTYLNKRGVPVNVLFFQVFAHGTDQILSRTWLLDPAHSQTAPVNKPNEPREPWNGEFYCSFGEGPNRSWEDAREFGFVCAGGGIWYSRTLQVLEPGGRVWVKAPGAGFVGVGRVKSRAVPAAEFQVETPSGKVSIFEAAKRANYHKETADDPERCEYFVPIQWLQTVPLSEAVQGIGFFGNQNSACAPTSLKWRSTVDKLKQEFPKFDEGNS